MREPSFRALRHSRLWPSSPSSRLLGKHINWYSQMDLTEFIERHRKLYPNGIVPVEHINILETIATDLGLPRPAPVYLVSEACLDLVKRFEPFEKRIAGDRVTAILDTEIDEDVWTIGWGSTGEDIQADTIWTVAQAEERLRNQIESIAQGVSDLLGGAPTKQHQFDALTSFAYQTGLSQFASSELLSKHRSGDYAGAASEFRKWNKIGNKKRVRRWLVNRRAAEATLYEGK
jgi:lysozyme